MSGKGLVIGSDGMTEQLFATPNDIVTMPIQLPVALANCENTMSETTVATIDLAKFNALGQNLDIYIYVLTANTDTSSITGNFAVKLNGNPIVYGGTVQWVSNLAEVAIVRKLKFLHLGSKILFADYTGSSSTNYEPALRSLFQPPTNNEFYNAPSTHYYSSVYIDYPSSSNVLTITLKFATASALLYYRPQNVIAKVY